jgi:hypothetical protein
MLGTTAIKKRTVAMNAVNWFRRSAILAALCASWISAQAWAEDWPAWRGPRGDGTSAETQLPTQWNGQTGQNIAWKAAVPGEGHGSPIVCGGRVFLASCLPESKERILCCFDRRDGRLLWQRTIVKSQLEIKHQLNSFASSTPACDGECVYVAFLEIDGSEAPATNVGTPRPLNPGQIVVACLDVDGNLRWLARPGAFRSVHGFCSNPVLFDDLVIINGDHDGDGYIVALRKQTGQIAWKKPRSHNTRSYVTPLIRKIAGRPQMVLSGSHHVASLDPRDGASIWRVDGPTEQFVASMVYDGKHFYMAAGYPTYHVLAIKPGGQGNVTETHVAWHSTNVNCYVPSPVVAGPYLLVADDRGTANCFDTATGTRLWLARLGTHYSASLIEAAGLVYFLADDGVTKIVKPGPALEVVAENPLGEDCYASAAASNGQFFVRAKEHLYCIGGR